MGPRLAARTDVCLALRRSPTAGRGRARAQQMGNFRGFLSESLDGAVQTPLSALCSLCSAPHCHSITMLPVPPSVSKLHSKGQNRSVTYTQSGQVLFLD